MERIKYICANCGWETSIIAQWRDLKPKRCMNAKCNTSFRLHPEALIVKEPKTVKVEKPKQKEQVNESKKQASRKQKSSSKN